VRVRQVPLGDIKPYPGNPRRNHDVERIAASIKAFGWRQPIVVWEGDGYVVAGHGRLLAAQHLGQAKVPVHYVPVSEMSAEQARAYRLMDNRSAEAATWDVELLGEEFKSLLEANLSDIAGFSEEEMRALLDGASAWGHNAKLDVEHDEEDLWPVIRVKVPPDVADRWSGYLKAFTGMPEHEAFANLLDRS